MAQRPTDRERKQELIAALAASRASLQLDRTRIKQQVNPLLLVRSAIRNHPIPVFATTATGALLLTLILRRRKRNSQPVSTRRMLLRWTLSLVRPVARLWLANWAKDRLLPTSSPFEPSDSAHTP